MEPFVHVPRIAAELDPGWTVGEQADFTSPGGVSIHVALRRAPDGLDAAGLAASHRDTLVSRLDGFVELSVSETASRGVPGQERRLTFDLDGRPSVGRIVYFVDDGVACTVSASWPTENQSADADVDHLVAGLRILAPPPDHDAVLSAGDPSTNSTSKTPRRDTVDAASWATLRRAWSEPGGHDAGAEPASVTRWSPEELLALAATHGLPAFPTVPSDLLMALPVAGRSAVLGAVLRSMIARGVIVDDGGRAAVAGEGCEAIEVALAPDLVMEIERLQPDGSAVWWYGVRPDAAVRVALGPHGAREIRAMSPGVVLDDIAGVTGLDGRAPSSESRELDGDQLLVDGSGVAAVVRARSAWRDGTATVGGVVDWVEHDDGSVSLAVVSPDDSPRDSAGSQWRLSPGGSDRLRAELLAHLPGA